MEAYIYGGVAVVLIIGAVILSRRSRKSGENKAKLKQAEAVNKAQEATIDAHETVEQLDTDTVRDRLREHARAKGLPD